MADIHFDYRIALKVAEYGADCLRINPGNIGNEHRVRSVVDCARDRNIPIRIGVNGGSLERDLQENMVNLPLKRLWSLHYAMWNTWINMIFRTLR